MFYDITNTAFLTSDLLYMTSHPLFQASHHFTYDIKSTVSEVTSTVSVSSYPYYWWHHSHYMDGITSSIFVTSYPQIYDIICTKYDITTLSVNDNSLSIRVTSFALQMTSHPLYHTKPQYLWCHNHFRNDITSPVSDIAPTVSLSSQPLLISHPLLNDITPTFCVTSYALYITSHPNLMSSHYSTYDITASIYENTSRI